MSEATLYRGSSKTKSTTPQEPMLVGLYLFMGPYFRVQWYLAHKKQPPPRDPTVALCQGPMVFLGGWVFLMSEVPLYAGRPLHMGLGPPNKRCWALQGYLAHQTPPTPQEHHRSLGKELL